ncbi:MAG: hypothetical protein JKP98_24480 [Rhodobacteraceae bacterium]|nr:hypothetical protein [Paracoccaceae bacterium]
MDDPDAALAELDRIEGARTEALRARALAAGARPSRARCPVARGQCRASRRCCLAGGDWETVRALGEAPQRAALAAAARLRPSPTPRQA